MAESREVNFDQVENDEIVTKVKRFPQDGCRCSRSIKGGQCFQQFLLEAVLMNVLDLVILAIIQAFNSFEVTGRKKEKSTL